MGASPILCPELGEDFERYHDVLLGLAYRMVGSVTEAEDIVQEAWLRWYRIDRSQVVEPLAFLVRITTRTAVDCLRRAKIRRETYVGPWLPEPLLTSPDIAEDVQYAELLSMAMMVVLETLSPLERAVFVLREAFACPYTEIGSIVGRSEATVRQVAHRARAHVAERRPRFTADYHLRREVTERFLAACLGGDLDKLLELLAPGVTLWSDGGGLTGGPRRPVQGRARVAAVLATVPGRGPARKEAEFTDMNGGPAAVITAGRQPIAVVVLGVAPCSQPVTEVWVVANPCKLSGVRAGHRHQAGHADIQQRNPVRM